MPYVPSEIEEKWQRRWADAGVAEVDVARAGEKFYMLNMFPYPSGDLHVGHGRNYILGDAIFRAFRMRGRMALNPMGWDAFGLPAETAAIKRGTPPPATPSWRTPSPAPSAGAGACPSTRGVGMRSAFPPRTPPSSAARTRAS